MRLIRFASLGAAMMMAASGSGLAHESSGKIAPQTSLPASALGPASTVDAFHAALHRGDVKAASALLADEALIFEEGGVEWTKAEYASHHLPADAEFSKLVGSAITRRTGRSAGPLAWIASEGQMTGAFKGKAIDRVTTETMVLKRVGSAWKIVHIHWSSGARP